MLHTVLLRHEEPVAVERDVGAASVEAFNLNAMIGGELLLPFGLLLGCRRDGIELTVADAGEGIGGQRRDLSVLKLGGQPA